MDREARCRGPGRLEVQTALVGAAVVLTLVHARQQPAVDRARSHPVEDAGRFRTCRVQLPASRPSRGPVPAHHGVDAELVSRGDGPPGRARAASRRCRRRAQGPAPSPAGRRRHEPPARPVDTRLRVARRRSDDRQPARHGSRIVSRSSGPGGQHEEVRLAGARGRRPARTGSPRQLAGTPGLEQGRGLRRSGAFATMTRRSCLAAAGSSSAAGEARARVSWSFTPCSARPSDQQESGPGRTGSRDRGRAAVAVPKRAVSTPVADALEPGGGAHGPRRYATSWPTGRRSGARRAVRAPQPLVLAAGAVRSNTSSRARCAPARAPRRPRRDLRLDGSEVAGVPRSPAAGCGTGGTAPPAGAGRGRGGDAARGTRRPGARCAGGSRWRPSGRRRACR